MPLYLLHIEPAYKHARHYLGFTELAETIPDRVESHLTGRGSPLIRAAVNAGHRIELVRTWEEGSRGQERRYKTATASVYLCPICRPAHLAERRARRNGLPAPTLAAQRPEDRQTDPNPLRPPPVPVPDRRPPPDDDPGF